MEVHYKLISRLTIKLFNKEMQKQFATEKLFVEEIYITYQKAVEDYKVQYPTSNIVGKHFFYENKAFEDEILKLKFISDYTLQEAIQKLENESNVILPTEKEIKNFQVIFDYHIQRNDKLRDLEIEATYKEEIFEISNKVDKIEKQIAQLLSPDLQNEWEREIGGYFETLKDFKPKTALKLLDNFLNKKGKNKPNNDLLAFIHYQKGICYSFLDKKEEKFKSFITCYTLNPTPKEYKEQAILAHYDNEDFQTLQPILDDLQIEDPFNPIIWAISYFKTNINDFEELIGNTPKFVKQNTLFQQLIFSHYYRIDTSLILKYERDLFPSVESIKNTIDQLEINIDTINQSIFLVNWLFTLFMRSYNYMGFTSKLNQENIDVLNIINILLEKILKTTKGTEVSYPIFSAIYSFTRYATEKDKKYLLNAIKGMEEMPIEGNSFFLLICANFLQQEDNISSSLDVVELLEKVEQQDHERFLTLALKTFIYLKQANNEQASKTAIQSFNLINKIEYTYLLAYIHVITVIYRLNRLDESLINRLKLLEYTSIDIKNLVIGYTGCLLENSTVNNEEEIRNWLTIFKDNYQIIIYLGSLYYFTKQYDRAREVYKTISKDIIKLYPRELSYYIESLFFSSKETDTSLLLDFCEYFRKTYFFDEHLLYIEYTIRQKYLNWDKSLEVCELGYKEFPSEKWLVQVIWCLDKLNKKRKELHYYLAKFLEIDKASSIHIPYIVSVLERKYSIDKAIELAYKYDEPNIRMLLLGLNIKYSKKSKIKDKFKDKRIVEEGTYVTYVIDGENQNTILIDINSRNEGEKEFSQLLLNKKLNDEIPYSAKYGNQTKIVRIIRIEDKYGKAVRSVYNDASTPASGLPLETFKIDEKDPLNSLLKVIGNDVSEKKNYEEELLRKYYNYESSILQFSISHYFRQLYLLTVRTFRKTIGIHTIANIYTKKNIQKHTSYVLDFSSLCALFTITSKFKLQLPTLYISKYLVQTISTQIEYLKKEPDEYTMLLHGLPLYLQTKELDAKGFILWLKDISKWIKKNCKVVLSSKTVDLLHITYSSKGNISSDISFMLDTLLPTLSITEEKNSILITDDPIAYLSIHFPVLNKTASSEYFIKEILKEGGDVCSFFIDNRYIDNSFTCEELIKLYREKDDNQENLDKYNFVIDKIQSWNIDVCFYLILYILNTTNNQDDVEKIMISLYKNQTKDNPIDIMNTFKMRSLILNDETIIKLFRILYSIVYNNENS